MSHIRSRVLKFQAMRSPSPHLTIFHPHALAHSFITLETIAPPPAVLDPGPRARHRLIPGLGARHRLDCGLRAHRHRPLPQAICVPLLVIVVPPPSTSTPPPSERATAVNLDPSSLGACHHCPLPQALDMAFGEGDTPPLPHYRCHLVRFERYLLPM
jgi:hypothetical protein